LIEGGTGEYRSNSALHRHLERHKGF